MPLPRELVIVEATTGKGALVVTYEPRRSRRRIAVALAVLCGLVAAAAGCGGNDKPAVCGDLEQLSSDIDTLQGIDLTSGNGAIADLDASLQAITTDLKTVKTDASAELSEPIAGLETSLGAVSTEFDTAKADDNLSSTEAKSLLDSLAAVSTSWEALKTAAPDCGLK